MGRHSNGNTFSPNDSNTYCDITGFKVKRSQVMKRWDGFYVIGAAWHPRHPQDTPVVPVTQRTFDNVRTEDLTTDSAPGFDIV